MIRVFIALGSNLADPIVQATTALTALQVLPDSQFKQCSSFYRTKPLGSVNQPDYLNAVLEITTDLPALTLLTYTQEIEQQQGRQRDGIRWGPRTLDLDILLYGQQIIQTPKLTIPHYDMHNRLFMLYPLYEIAPDLILPNGQSIISIIKKLPDQNIHLWV